MLYRSIYQFSKRFFKGIAKKLWTYIFVLFGVETKGIADQFKANVLIVQRSSQSICNTNQLTCLYMIQTLALIELKILPIVIAFDKGA